MAQTLVSTGVPFGPDYLRGLNDQQRIAVEALDGPVLVLAGAGVGKTRVLTSRIAHILATGRARENEVLALTFTNKAAHEMRERLERMSGGQLVMPWLGTFHALGVKVLRRYAEQAGLTSNFSILDDDDQLRLLKQLLKDGNVDEKRWPARSLAAAIDRWKNRAIEPGKVPAGEGAEVAAGRGDAFYAAYQARLKTLNAVDFGDLLLEPLRLLRANAEILSFYQRTSRYVLVDKYQDTNTVQYMWLRLLVQRSRNLCCVGDDDQSIYSWRGADVENILRFEKDFPDAKIIRLERNYRSTAHILGLASGLISHNRSRLGKTLFTDQADGALARLLGFRDSLEEAREIADRIEDAQRRGVSLDDIAVLVRASFQMRAFEERFLEIGLPYRIIGGPRFYERAEIRDAIAYLRLIAQPNDDLAFERVVNVPRRGLGDSTLKVLREFARGRSLALAPSARILIESEELRAAARAALRAFLADVERWRGQLASLSHGQLTQTVLEESGYLGMWRSEKTEEAKGRIENLEELVRSMEDFPTLQAFLEHVSLVMDAGLADGAQRVSIMTLHAAKGLEFTSVFLPGWEEGLFPHPRSLEESGRAGLEEERRLAYVGITRARQEVTITYAANRQVRGLWQPAARSRFVEELPTNHVEYADSYRDTVARSWSAASPDVGFSSRYNTPGWQRARAGGGEGFRSAAPSARGEGLGPSGVSFAAGDPVFHQKFGAGTVAATDGDKISVDFEMAGRKLVMAHFLRPGQGS